KVIGSTPGIVGRFHLVRTADGIPGVKFNGDFLIELNTFSTPQTVQTFQIDTDGRFVRDANNKLKVIDQEIANGFRLKLRGTLNIADVIVIDGKFSFSIDSTGL